MRALCTHACMHTHTHTHACTHAHTHMNINLHGYTLLCVLAFLKFWGLEFWNLHISIFVCSCLFHVLFCFSGLARIVSELINQSDPGTLHHLKSDMSWLCCVPLLHFLQGKSQPYQDLEPSPHFKRSEWWGLTGLERRKRSFMEGTTHWE